VKDADLVGQHHEVQQHVGVDDEKQGGPEHEEADERQVDAEEGELDRALE